MGIEGFNFSTLSADVKHLMLPVYILRKDKLISSSNEVSF